MCKGTSDDQTVHQREGKKPIIHSSNTPGNTGVFLMKNSNFSYPQSLFFVDHKGKTIQSKENTNEEDFHGRSDTKHP